MEAKNEALELAQIIDNDGKGCKCCAYSSSECACNAIWAEPSMRRISAMLRSQAAEIEKLRESYQSACLLVADMHEAAMGGVMGPVLGVVEDVAALRAERDQLKAKNEKLIAWLGSNLTFYDVDPRRHTQHPNIPVLAGVSKRIWYHATDNQLDFPFSQVVRSALKENT